MSLNLIDKGMACLLMVMLISVFMKMENAWSGDFDDGRWFFYLFMFIHFDSHFREEKTCLWTNKMHAIYTNFAKCIFYVGFWWYFFHFFFFFCFLYTKDFSKLSTLLCKQFFILTNYTCILNYDILKLEYFKLNFLCKMKFSN